MTKTNNNYTRNKPTKQTNKQTKDLINSNNNYKKKKQKKTIVIKQSKIRYKAK